MPAASRRAARLGVARLLAAALCLGLPHTPARAAEPAPGWTGTCAAEACLYRRAAAEGTATLLLARRAGGDGRDGLAIGFAFSGANADRTRPAALSLDGQPLATLRPERDVRPIAEATEVWLVGPAILAAVAQQLAKGGMLRLSYLDVLGGPHDATFDLGGSGDIVATMAVGDVAKPVTVAPVPRSDLVLPDRLSEIRRLGVPERLAGLHGRMTTCEALDSPALADRAPVVAELSPTAVLYALPCAAGRDALLSKLWVIEFGEIGGIAPQSFALFQPTLGWYGADLLPNVAWDAGRLTARAITADGCAWTATWRWHGTRFGLDAFSLAACGRRPAARVYPAK